MSINTVDAVRGRSWRSGLLTVLSTVKVFNAGGKKTALWIAFGACCTVGLLLGGWFLMPQGPISETSPQPEHADSIPDMRHDFGVVRPGSQLTHRFTITNTTSETWKLASVERPSCACSLVEASGETFAPRESQTFEFKYRVSGQVNDDSHTVKLHFETPAETQVALTVSARVRHPMTLLPAELSYGQVTQGGKATQKLRIENYSDADWPGVNIPKLPPWIHLGRMEKLPGRPDGFPRQVWEAEFTLDVAGHPVGSFQETVFVESADKKHQSSLPIRGHIADDITIAPTLINFGKIDPSKGGQATMLVRVNGSRGKVFSPDLVIVSSASGDKLDCRWTNRSAGLWILTVNLWPVSPRESFVNGKLLIRSQQGIADRSVNYSAWVMAGQTEGAARKE